MHIQDKLILFCLKHSLIKLVFFLYIWLNDATIYYVLRLSMYTHRKRIYNKIHLQDKLMVFRLNYNLVKIVRLYLLNETHMNKKLHL